MPYPRNNSGGTDLANTPEVIQLRAQIAQLSAKVAAGPDLSGIYATLASLQNQINALGPTAPIAITGTPGAATVSTVYSFIPTVSGGSGVSRAFTFNGTLVSGWSFNTATGAVTNPSPSASLPLGPFSITVQDSSGFATLSGLSIPVSSGSVTPTLSLTGPATYVTPPVSGSVVFNIGNVPAGVTPTLTAPTDGTLVIGGSQANGWTVVTGMVAGTVQAAQPVAVAATGANPASATAAVTSAQTGSAITVSSIPVTVSSTQVAVA